MKHKIVIGLCIIAVVVLSIVAVSTWHTQSVQERVSAAKSYATRQAHDLHQKAAVEAEKHRLHDECVKQLTFYTGLAPAQQKLTAKPQCDLRVVE